MTTPQWPTPVPDVWSRPFWDAAAEHRLVAQRCEGCGALRHPPGPGCPSCGSTATAWVDLSGRGTVESWVVFRQAYFPGLPVPYGVVQLRLEEGLRFISNLVGVPDDEVRIGLPVEVVFEPGPDGFVVPRFTRSAG